MNTHNRNFSIFFIIGLVLLLTPLLSAEDLSHKLNTDFTYSITSNNATECNLTTMNTPNGLVFIQQITTKFGNTFNLSIDQGNFTSTGIYELNLVCTDGVQKETGSKRIIVTPSGSQLDSGKSISLFGSLILLIGLSTLLFIIGFKSENNTAKISFFAFSGLSFIMTILYAVVIMQQTLFGFDSILSGIETFWYVAKMFVWIGFVALGIVIFLIMLKAWKIKRGLIDED